MLTGTCVHITSILKCLNVPEKSNFLSYALNHLRSGTCFLRTSSSDSQCLQLLRCQFVTSYFFYFCFYSVLMIMIIILHYSIKKGKKMHKIIKEIKKLLPLTFLSGLATNEGADEKLCLALFQS